MISLGGSSIVAALSLAGIWLQSRHEGANDWRQRLIAAADDFAIGWSKTTAKLRDAIEEASTSQARIATVQAKVMVDELVERAIRVELLFGESSPTARAAGETLTALRSAEMAASRADSHDAYAQLDTAFKQFNAFMSAAHAALR
jgi:hypothetical protein